MQNKAGMIVHSYNDINVSATSRCSGLIKSKFDISFGR